MAIKRRVSSFVTNWLGVIIAVVIVAVSGFFGGTYLYAVGRIDSTLAWVTESINLKVPPGLAYVGTSDNPPGQHYHVTLDIVNESGDTAEASLTGVYVKLAEFTFPVTPDGTWDKSIPTGETDFEGDIFVESGTVSTLVAEGNIQIDVTGSINGTGCYKWITRHKELTFSRSTTGHFPTS